MTCPDFESESHLRDCAACRAAVEWLRTICEPGLHCLGPEEMASAIDGRKRPAHLRTCPRCAAEFRALKPARRKTRRYATASWGRWIAAAAAALAMVVTGAVLWLRSRPAPQAESPQAVQSPRKTPEWNASDPEPAEKKTSDPEREEPKRLDPNQPALVNPKPGEDPKSKPEETRPERSPDRIEVAVRRGSLFVLDNGSWVRAGEIFDHSKIRAEGRTTLEFAGARVDLEASTRFSLEKTRLSLEKGGLAAEIPSTSNFALRLGAVSVSRDPGPGRVLLVARDDRVIVEEGSARAGDVALAEGVEYDLDLRKRARSLPAAVRSREALTWRLDIANANATRGRLPRGKIQGPSLVSTRMEDQTYHYGGIQYFAGGDAVTFTVKPTTAVRFRYFLRERAKLTFSLRNKTKDESFTIDLEPVAGAWTTITLPVAEIPVNTGGRKVTCSIGDRYGWFGWNVGEPGKPAEVLIDEFQILEIAP